MSSLMRPSALLKQAVAMTLLLGACGATTPIDEANLEQASGYDFGRSPDLLRVIEESVRALTPADMRAAERQLLDRIRAGGSPGWKDFLCRQLSLVGSEDSVEVLIPMLKDEQTADVAIYAMERIPGEKINASLRQAASEVPVKTQIRIAATLGARRDPEAVGLLAGFLKGPDDGLSQAAAVALGRIGSDTAGKALAQALDKGTAPLRVRVTDAYLGCAESLARAGQDKQAMTIYKQVYGSGQESRFRAAALRGWIAVDRTHAGTILLTALQQPDQDLATAAASMVCAIDDPDQLRPVVEYLPKLHEAGKVVMLASLAQGRRRMAMAYVLSAAEADGGTAQVAAVRALGSLGDESVVAYLASTAVRSTGELRQAARQSLYQLSADGVDGQVLEAARAADLATQEELILAIRQRRIQGATDLLIRAATGANADLMRQSLLALGDLGGAEDLPAVAALLLKSPGSDLEDAIVAIAGRIKDPGQRSAAVLAVVDSTKDQAVRGAALRILGRLGSDEALAILRVDVRSSDPKIRTEAVRIMAEWPNPVPMQDLWGIAKNDQDLTDQVLALRGYIRMVPLREDVAAQDKVKDLSNAMSVARRDDEKKRVLSILPQCACAEALDLAEAALEDKALKPEAEMAIVKVRASLARIHPL